jgi:hypothetical protein
VDVVLGDEAASFCHGPSRHDAKDTAENPTQRGHLGNIN